MQCNPNGKIQNAELTNRLAFPFFAFSKFTLFVCVAMYVAVMSVTYEDDDDDNDRRWSMKKLKLTEWIFLWDAARHCTLLQAILKTIDIYGGSKTKWQSVLQKKRDCFLCKYNNAVWLLKVKNNFYRWWRQSIGLQYNRKCP